jgi:hypothetical protein
MAGGTQPAVDAKVRRVLEDWKARQERYKCVRYTLSGTKEEVGELPLSPEMQARVIRPPGPKKYPIKAVILIDLVNDRFRLEELSRRISPDRSKWVLENRVSAYNGKVHQIWLPRELNELAPIEHELSIIKGNLGYYHVETHLWPVFMAHGIVPTPNAPIWVDRFPKNHEPAEFILAGSVIHDGKSCLVLKMEPSPLSYEVWLESEKASAIARFIGWDVTRKNPFVRLDIRYQVTAMQDRPESWAQTTTIGTKVMKIAKLKVEAFEADVPLNDADFTLPIRPGMIVKEFEYPPRGKGLDTSRPSERTYSASESGALKPEGVQRGFTTWDGVELPPESKRQWHWWAIAGFLGFAVIAAVWLWRRSRRKIL